MHRWTAFPRDLGLQLFRLNLLLVIPFLITLWIFDGRPGVPIREDVQACDSSSAQSIAQEVELAISQTHGIQCCSSTNSRWGSSSLIKGYEDLKMTLFTPNW